MKAFAIFVYGIILLLSLVLMFSAFIGNLHLDWSWRADRMAQTFIMMIIFSALLIIMQYLASSFSLFLLLQCGIVGGLLFGSSLYHMFPEKSIWFARLHLFMAVLFIVWNFYNGYRFMGATNTK